MGRPIQQKWFGTPDSAGYQLKITAKISGEAVSEGFITEQTGTRKYKVNVGGVIGTVRLVNKLVGGNLVDGEAFVSAIPFGGTAQAVSKITQYRISLFDADGGFSTYEWSQADAAAVGQATLLNDDVVSNITATATATFEGTGGTVDSITLVQGGGGYVAVPEVTISGVNGTGATATATIANGVVDSLTIDTAGTGYTEDPTVTIESPESANL